MILKSGKTLLLLSALVFRCLQATFVSSLPQCVQDCIDNSHDDNCYITDIACLCRASAGTFLPDLITCIHNDCDNDLDNDLLLAPLQVVCDLAGAPIPESVIQSAENQASSFNTQVITTFTAGGASPTAGSEASTPVSITMTQLSISTKTVTKTESGETIYVVYPTTVASTSVVSGKPSRSPSTTTGHSSSGTRSGLISSTTSFTTSKKAAETSSSRSASSPTAARNPAMTNSSPFTTTNGNGANKRIVGSHLLAFSVLLMIFRFCY